MFRILFIAIAALIGLFTLLAAPAAADHGEGHNGETLEVSNDTEVADGEILTVDLSSFVPGNTATVVTCYKYPATGPSDCELSNYGQHQVEIGDDGSGTIDYPVKHVPGRCDADNSCFIVAGDGFGPAANYAAAAITFGASAEVEETTTTTEATTTTEETSTTEAEPEAVIDADEAEVSESDDAADDSDDADSDDADSDDGGSGWVLPAIVIAVLGAGLGAFVARRKKD